MTININSKNMLTENQTYTCYDAASVSPSEEFNLFFGEFLLAKGYKFEHLSDLSIDVLTPLIPVAMAAYLAKDLPVDSIFNVSYPGDIKLLYLKKSLYELYVEQETAFKSFGLDINDPESQAAIKADSYHKLGATQYFTHPLSQVTLDNQPNDYLIASTFINVYRGNIHYPVKNDTEREIAIDNAKTGIAQLCLAANPAVNIKLLLDQINAGCYKTMLSTCDLIVKALTNISQNFNN